MPRMKKAVLSLACPTKAIVVPEIAVGESVADPPEDLTLTVVTAYLVSLLCVPSRIKPIASTR